MDLSTFIPELEDRFLRYVQIDSPADEASGNVPSTAGQWDILHLLEAELSDIGAADVRLTDYGCVLATLPASAGHEGAPAVAFLAHIDTAPAYNGLGVKPRVHRGYDGGDIAFPDDPELVLRPEEFPYLRQKIGEDLVTASGTTLLGADDKAGVAIIMAMASYLLAHPEMEHGPIRLCFTPDEEIGAGIRHLTLSDLAADVAYTLDGQEAGEITYETFSADKAVVTITGVSTHTGTAFNVLVNALHLAANLISLLPQHTRTPETTRDRQGFIHVYQMKGTAAEAELHFILRDYELAGLQAHGDLLRAACNTLQLGEPRARFRCAITPQYRNMRYWLENDMRPVHLAEEAIRRAGLQILRTPVRGGTDGSQLTEKGVPTPNIFTGMQNVHGPMEWISLHDMARATQVCIELARLWAAQTQS